MFWRLLRHPKGELYRMLKIIVTLINYSFEVDLYTYMGSQLNYNYVKTYLVQHKSLDVKSHCIRLFLYLFVEKYYFYFL